MAKKWANDKITKADIEDYLNKFSDFAFEVKVLKVLISSGLACRHSGSYTDPITGKIREYDIRGTHDNKAGKFKMRQYFAVECKNLSPNFPLVVHCVKRKREEAFFDLIMSFYSGAYSANVAKTLNQSRDLHRYKIGEPVGKSTDQVGRQARGEIIASDADVFEKISQAITSSKDLIDSAVASGIPNFITMSFINPLLVVPDGTLWQIIYNEQGEVVSGPEEVDFVTYFYNKEWSYLYLDDSRKDKFTISHLDIISFSALEEYIGKIVNINEEDFRDFFIQLRDQNHMPGMPI